MDKLQQLLDHVKNYQRPVRMIIWCLCISFAFVYTIVIQSGKPIDPIATNMLWGMFADLGIYSVLRTQEKNKSALTDAAQDITKTVTEAGANSTTTTEVKVE